MYRDRGYNEPLMQRLGYGLAEGVAFVLEHWRPALVIIGAVAAWVNREQGEELTRKPELIDQIVANSLARCQPQARFPEKGTYELRLREVLGTGVRSKAFDAYMTKNVTICLDQRVPDFKGHFIDNTFYAAYYYNGGEPVLALRDNGKLAKESGMMETRNKERSNETLNKFAHQYLLGEHAPQDAMLAYKESRRCGDNCTDYYSHWIKASAKQQATMKSHHGMDVPPLSAEAPPVKYSPAQW